jgi:hypothetical protein
MGCSCAKEDLGGTSIMPGGVEVQSLRKRRQQSKKLKEKVNSMVAGSQTFLKAKLSVDCKQYLLIIL